MIATLLILAVLLVVLAAGSAYSSHRAEQEHPPSGLFVEVQGVKLHYAESVPSSRSGQNQHTLPTLVLLHGASTSLLDFQPGLAPQLSEHYRVLAFDRPGMGYSETLRRWMTPLEQAELILDALSVINSEQAIWIGHSWAGSVVLAAMQEHPDRVNAGVLLAGATHPWEGGVKLDTTLANVPIVGSLLARLIVPLVGRVVIEDAVEGVFRPETVTPDYIEKTGVRLSIRPEAFLNNAADLYNLSDWLETRYPLYRRLSQPILMITGTADNVVPSWNHAERVLADVPDAQWVSLEGAGHALHHTRTENVVAHIQTFVDGLSVTGQ